VVWCGTNNGVFRLTRSQNGWQPTSIPSALPKEDIVQPINALAFDHRGSLWIGTNVGHRRLPDGVAERYESYGLAGIASCCWTDERMGRYSRRGWLFW
jgi:hypothetical protein